VMLQPTLQKIALEFRGPEIRRLQFQPQLSLELSFRDPATLKELDSITLPLRSAFAYTLFDSGAAPRAIALTGTLTDRGVDNNGNRLFDQLAVNVGVELANSGFYEWSARLVDPSGIEIGFASGSASLSAGTRQIGLIFDGKAIGVKGFNGPYSVRSLLISGSSGSNSVSTFVGETSAYTAAQFEGYVARVPGDLNGDGVVNAADVELFNKALGSSIGDARFNSLADFDRDGRVTLNDLRILRKYLGS
jgi:hypothetical protein